MAALPPKISSGVEFVPIPLAKPSSSPSPVTNPQKITPITPRPSTQGPQSGLPPETVQQDLDQALASGAPAASNPDAIGRYDQLCSALPMLANTTDPQLMATPEPALESPASTPTSTQPVSAPSEPQPWDSLAKTLEHKAPELGPKAAMVAEYLHKMQEAKDPGKKMEALASLLVQLNQVPISADLLGVLKQQLKGLQSGPQTQPQAKALAGIVDKLFFDADPAKSVARIKQVQVLLNGKSDGSAKEMRALFEVVSEFGPEIRQLLPENWSKKVEKLQMQCGAALPDMARKLLPLMENSDIAKAMFKILTESGNVAEKGAAELPGVISGGVDLLIAVGRYQGVQNNDAFKAVTSFLKMDTLVADNWKALFGAWAKGDTDGAIRAVQLLAANYSVKVEDLSKNLGVLFDASTLDRLGVSSSSGAMDLIKRTGERNPEELLRKAELLGVMPDFNGLKMQDLPKILDQLNARTLDEAVDLIRGFEALDPKFPTGQAGFDEAVRRMEQCGCKTAEEGVSLMRQMGGALSNANWGDVQQGLKMLGLEGRGSEALGLLKKLGVETADQALVVIGDLGCKDGAQALELMDKLQVNSAQEALGALKKLGSNGNDALEILGRFGMTNGREAVTLMKTMGVSSLADLQEKLVASGLQNGEQALEQALGSDWSKLPLEAQNRLGATNAQEAGALLRQLGVPDARSAIALIEKSGVKNGAELLELSQRLGLRPGKDLLAQMQAIGFEPKGVASTLLRRSVSSGSDLLALLRESGIQGADDLKRLQSLTGITDLRQGMTAMKQVGAKNLSELATQLERAGLSDLSSAKAAFQRTGLTQLSELANLSERLGVKSSEAAIQLLDQLEIRPQTGQNALTLLTQTEEFVKTAFGTKLTLNEAMDLMRVVQAPSLSETARIAQALGETAPGTVSELISRTGVRNGAALVDMLQQTGSSHPSQLLGFMERTGAQSADEALGMMFSMGAHTVGEADQFLNVLGAGSRNYHGLEYGMQLLNDLGMDPQSAGEYMKKLGVPNLVALEKHLIDLGSHGIEGIRLSPPIAAGDLKQLLPLAQQISQELKQPLDQAVRTLTVLKADNVDDVLLVSKQLKMSPAELVKVWPEIGAKGLSAAKVGDLLHQADLHDVADLKKLISTTGATSLDKACQTLGDMGYEKAADWLQDATKMGVTNAAEASQLARRLGVTVPQLGAFSHLLELPAGKIEAAIKKHGFSNMAELNESVMRYGFGSLKEAEDALAKMEIPRLKDADKLSTAMGTTRLTAISEAMTQTGARNADELLALIKHTGAKSLESFMSQQADNLKLLTGLESDLGGALAPGHKVWFLTQLSQMEPQAAKEFAEGVGSHYRGKLNAATDMLTLMADLGPRELEALSASKSVMSDALRLMDEGAAFFKQMGIPLAMAAPKVLKGLGKMIPAIGTAVSVMDAQRLLDITLNGSHNGVNYPDPDVRKLAYVGTKLNTVDSLLGVSELFGVGNVGLPANIGLALSEIGVDVMIEYYNTNPKALTPTARQFIQALLYATGPLDGFAVDSLLGDQIPQ